MTSTSSDKFLAQGRHCAGQCNECKGFGILGTYCLDCQDSSMIYYLIDVDDLEEDQIGKCDKCESLGLRGSVCTECTAAFYKQPGDSFSDDERNTTSSAEISTSYDFDGYVSGETSDSKDTEKGNQNVTAARWITLFLFLCASVRQLAWQTIPSENIVMFYKVINYPVIFVSTGPLTGSLQCAYVFVSVDQCRHSAHGPNSIACFPSPKRIGAHLSAT